MFNLKFINRSVAIMILTIFFSAYANETKDDKKSELNALSEEVYTQPFDWTQTTYVPSILSTVIETSENKKISGTVYFRGAPIRYPAVGAQVVLFKDSKKIAQVMSNPNGEFVISHSFQKGSYILEASKNNKTIHKELQIKKSDIDGIILYLSEF